MSQKSVKHCPKCGAISKVTDSRLRTAKGVKMQRLARRRECPKCGHKYSTVEMPYGEYRDLMALKERLRIIAAAQNKRTNHEENTDV
jgi:transcriptional regulator NrdR family protein